MSNGRAIAREEDRALGPARSGRRFVIVAVVALLLVWGSLFVIFRQWRARHEALAAFGAREVAPLVDPLAGRVPPGIDAKVWRRAVGDTHAMLVAATASGTIDLAGMVQLRDILRERVARDTPETARADLTRLWDEMQKRVGPILAGSTSRPPHCPPRPEVLRGKADSPKRAQRPQREGK